MFVVDMLLLLCSTAALRPCPVDNNSKSSIKMRLNFGQDDVVVRFFGLVIDIWWRSVYCGSVRRVAFVFLGWRGRDLVFAVASLPRGQWGRGARGADPD